MDNNQKKDKKIEEDCPLCNISEETLAKLKAADKNKKEQEKK